MPELTITVSEKLYKFLDRYYTSEPNMTMKFYTALSEGAILIKGKNFCLSFKSNLIYNDMLIEEQRINDAYYEDMS